MILHCSVNCGRVVCMLGCNRARQQPPNPNAQPSGHDPFGVERRSRDELTAAINRLCDLIESQGLGEILSHLTSEQGRPPQ